MKHYGVLHGKYQDYSSIARKLLGQLKAQMDTTGQKFGSWNRKLSDGAILHISIIMNGPVPIYKAVVTPALEEEETIIRVVVLTFENGQLGVAPWESTTTHSIDIGTELTNYFASTGTEIVTRSGNLFHLQGDVDFDSQDFLADTPGKILPATTYSSAIYVPGGNSQKLQLMQQLETERFESISPINPSVTISSNYTGVMRLAVQSLLAVGRSPGPATYATTTGGFASTSASNYPCPYTEPKPLTDGLIYDSAYNFWWVRVDSASVAFRKLKVKDEFLYTQTALVAGIADEDTKRKYLMTLMSALDPDTTVSEVSVSVSGLANIVGGGRTATAYGWHFNHQAPWAAAIVTQREGAGSVTSNWYREATQGVLSFSFDIDGVPACSASSLVQDAKFSLPVIHTFWSQSASGAFCPLGVPLGVTRAEYPGAVIPLYCYYKQDGDLVTVEWHHEETGTEAAEPALPGWYSCGIGEWYYSQKSSRDYSYGGFKATNTSVDYSSGNESGSYTFNYKTNKVIFDSSLTPTCSSINISNGLGSCDGAWPQTIGDLQSAVGYANAEFYLRCSDLVDTKATAESESGLNQTVSVEAYMQFVVVPLNDAEAAFVGKYVREYFGFHVRSFYDKPGATWTVSRVVNDVMWRSISDGITTWTPAGLSWVAQFRIFSPGLALDHNENIPAEEIISGPVTLITSRDEFESSSADNGWVGCLGYDLTNPCVGGCGADASMAYKSGGYYKHNDESRNRMVIEGYPALGASDPSEVRWIGDA